MADYNPFQGMLNPNMSRGANLWDLRMMSAANRMEQPFERGMRGMYGRRGVSGDPMLAGMAGMANEPDYSGFTYDPAMRQQAIAAGVHPLEANQVQNNVFLPNTGFFGRHPRLSAALESGMFGAMAAHGGETAGESIQGALSGALGGQRMRQGLWRQQFARPFEQAGALEGLRDMQQRRELQAAQIKHYSSEADIQAERIQLERDKNALGYDKLNATRPVPVEGGTYVYNPSAPEGKGWEFQAGPGKGAGERDLDIGTREQLKIMGVAPGAATPAQISQANQRSQQQAIQRNAAMAGGRNAAELPYQNYKDARSQHDKRQTELQGKLLKSDDPSHLQSARDILFYNWMTQSAEAKQAGHPAPPMPNESNVKDYINQQNAAVQKQMRDEDEQFKQDWPQALEHPPSSSPKTGSPSRNKRYNPATGQIE